MRVTYLTSGFIGRCLPGYDAGFSALTGRTAKAGSLDPTTWC